MQRTGRICVVTSRSREYFSIVSRLRRAGLPFVSLVPGASCDGFDLVLTTAAEAGACGPRAVAADELDGDPFVFKGQVLSRLGGGGDDLVVGVDPGSRIGLAVFYGEASVAYATFDSLEGAVAGAAAFLERVPSRRKVVRVGRGDPATAMALALAFADRAPQALVELVDESGTSSRRPRLKGVQGDQRAAAKIAFRKGDPYVRPQKA